MSSADRVGAACASPSLLLSALRRVGMRLPIVHDVEGYFTPSEQTISGSRMFGTLETSDARVLVGFDRTKVALPIGPGQMRVSGKLWLGERTSAVTLMVNRYTILGSVRSPDARAGDELVAVEGS
ncbi:hypothetical protein ACT2FY_38805 [Paraburkholderia fungorum]|uniref:hypothetical protein n=1 Tax=Paraburkholderia fungorum TaxID=134537 RepID=UPI00402B6865